MNEMQQAAYIMAMAACAQVEATAMVAENNNLHSKGQAPKYYESDFEGLIQKYGIHHNAVCVVQDLDTHYQLWLLQAPIGGWMSLKLTATQRRRKANYWFGWSLTTNRSNGARDLEKTMKSYDPKLYRLVVQSLKAYVGEQQK